MQTYTLALALWIIAPYSISMALACKVNVTIDDTFGDERTGQVPIYTSATAWGESAPVCRCDMNPDPAQMHNQTWHVHESRPGQIPANITFTFRVVANARMTILSPDTRLAFYLDGDLYSPTTFFQAPSNDTTGEGYNYNQLVFSNTSLPHGKRTMLMSSLTTSDSGSIVLFDYAVYT
ncbi:hypothetical protein EXIGLDRAFT_706332 [Exidia glandulosa HHB12029]|uniref:Galactose-binding like protein n=1 Tax=Exidia glandulosa HHB12029 TaxID=1314781 RepID=A0A165K7R1_EXIGL|nr:hypothetical protein EXIGLDRAFT_706332 [Exidia glandulosa HHB12029]